jgi:hypothetical protein
MYSSIHSSAFTFTTSVKSQEIPVEVIAAILLQEYVTHVLAVITIDPVSITVQEPKRS